MVEVGFQKIGAPTTKGLTLSVVGFAIMEEGDHLPDPGAF